MKSGKYICSAFLIFVLTGCLQVETLVTVNRDGSGTIKETVVMGEFLTGILGSFSNLFDEDSVQQNEDFSFFTEEDLEKKSESFGEGVKLVESTEIKLEKKLGYNAVYSFDDINKIKISQDPDSNSPLDMDDQPDTSGKNNLTFNFKKGEPSNLLIHVPLKEMEEEVIEEEAAKEDTTVVSAEDREELWQLMEDFKIETKIIFEGEIKSTNASFVQGNEVTILSIDMTKLIEDAKKLEELNSMDLRNFNEIMDLIKNIPGFKMEYQSKVMVEFD